MRDSIGILRMLDVLILGTQTKTKATIQLKDTKGKNGLRMTRVINWHFRSNPTLRGYKERIMEILPEFAKFNATSQRFADQMRMIIKKGWFSHLEILEMCKLVSR